MADIGWLMLTGLGAWGIGDILLSCLFSKSRGASALTLGLALFSTLCLTLGLLGALEVWLLRGLVAALALLGLGRLWRRRALLRHWPRRPDGQELVLVLLLGISVALSTLAAHDPPTLEGLSHYHLRAPTLWLEHGRVSWPFKDLPYHYPQGMELLYALGLAVGSARTPQLLHLLTAVATLWGVMSFAQRRWGRKVALLACLFYWSIPEVHYLATIPLVDLAWSSAEVLAVLAFVDGLDMSSRKERLRQWALAGALVGWAAAVKYSALWTVLFLGIGVVWASVSTELAEHDIPFRLRIVLRDSIVYAAPAVVLAVFWYAKNWVRFGNPVYPFLWGGRGLALEVARTWTGLLRRFGPSRTLWRFLRLPWDIFMTRRIPAMRPVLYPYPVALIPLLVVYRRWGRVVTVCLIFCFAYLTAWYWTGTLQLRFILTPMTLSCLLAARGGHEILRDRRFPAAIIGFLILVALLLGLGLQWQVLAPHIFPDTTSGIVGPDAWPRW